MLDIDDDIFPNLIILGAVCWGLYLLNPQFKQFVHVRIQPWWNSYQEQIQLGETIDNFFEGLTNVD
ncbi:hypothetical protein IQ268_28045 [Oculatella sp. LEGE 06141]|uniref:hypothetical protein n=1 Tax=Oculatella sp. LEGE 06141 TaxID=1828648 RepID=UPI00187FCFA0|nr:hypothetical protein [Oculatella sp. LEGE 06141]MBE9182404.1 hypothetical protein [Oculatella sp. LEGE 06141]